MKKPGFWGSVFLATGTMIGVGLLAVPVITGLLGFIPGLALTLLAVLMMWLSGTFIAERTLALKIPDGDIASLYSEDLGNWVRWISVPVYLLLFYAILVAYLSAAGNIISNITPLAVSPPVWILAVFAFCSLLMLFGQNLMIRLNGVIVSLMLGFFITMLLASLRNVSGTNLTHVNLSAAPLTLPVLACAFTYHSVIPLICRRLENDRRTVHAALFTAVLIALMMTALWLLVVSGTIPFNAEDQAPSLLNAYRNGTPATVPLAQVTGSRIIAACADGFSLMALLTSYIGIGAALTSFIRDLCPPLRPANRAGLLFCIVFLPPLTLALVEPNIFLSMVGVAGGFGVIVLFGILPVAAFQKTQARGKPMLQILTWLMMIFFVCVFVIELTNVLHLYTPTPDF